MTCFKCRAPLREGETTTFVATTHVQGATRTSRTTFKSFVCPTCQKVRAVQAS